MFISTLQTPDPFLEFCVLELMSVPKMLESLHSLT